MPSDTTDIVKGFFPTCMQAWNVKKTGHLSLNTYIGKRIMSNSLFKNVSMEEFMPANLVEGDVDVLASAALEAEIELVELNVEGDAASRAMARIDVISAGVESFGEEVDATTLSVIDFSIESLTESLEGYDEVALEGETMDKIKVGAKKAWAAVVKFLRGISDWIRKHLAAFMDWVAKAGAAFRKKYNSIQKLKDTDTIKVTTWDLGKSNEGDKEPASEDGTSDAIITIGSKRLTYLAADASFKVEASGLEKTEQTMSKKEAMDKLENYNTGMTTRNKELLAMKQAFRDTGKFKPEDTPTDAEKEAAKKLRKQAKFGTKFSVKAMKTMLKAAGEVYSDVNKAAKATLAESKKAGDAPKEGDAAA